MQVKVDPILRKSISKSNNRNMTTSHTLNKVNNIKTISTMNKSDIDIYKTDFENVKH